MHLVEVAALLHDVQDWKYSQSEGASRASVQVCCRDSWRLRALPLLTTHSALLWHTQGFLESQSISEDHEAQILSIIAGVGFKVSAMVHLEA